jgi:hypothetical protein
VHIRDNRIDSGVRERSVIEGRHLLRGQWRAAAGLRIRARKPALVKYIIAAIGRSKSGWP